MKVSVVQTSDLDQIVSRLDAEFYRPKHLRLQELLDKHERISIQDAGATLDCSAFYPAITSYYSFDGEGVPFLRVNEIQEGLVRLTADTAYLPEEVLERNSSTIARCRPGDLVIAKGGNSLGKVALLTDEHPSYAVSRDVLIIRTGGLAKLNPYYLWLFLHSRHGQQLVLRSASQTGQPHLTLEALRQLRVARLSEQFQAQCEQVHDEARTLAHNYRHLYQTAKRQLATALGLEDWDPSHQLSFIAPAREAKAAGRLDAEYFQPRFRDIEGAIQKSPEGYERLADLVDIKKGLEVGSAAYLDQGVPFVRVRDLTPAAIGEEKYISEDLYRDLKGKGNQPTKGEILLTKDGSPGIAHYLDTHPKRMIVSSGILRLNSRDQRVSHRYLTLVLNSRIVAEQVARDSGGSVILHWRPEEVGETLIPILSSEDQETIGRALQTAVESLRRSRALLAANKEAVEIALDEGEEMAVACLSST